jgi:glycine oxidase
VQHSDDILIIGAGIIGLSLGWQLSRRGARVKILERAEPGQEASHAGGGMIADLDPVLPSELFSLAQRSARLYPEFVNALREESGLTVDLREDGVVAFEQHPLAERVGIRRLTAEEALRMEPRLSLPPDAAYFMQERAVDPRQVVAALLVALSKHGVEIVRNEAAERVLAEHGRAAGVVTAKGTHRAGKVVNCAGAWAAQIAGAATPTLPVKGHMVALAFPDELAIPANEREAGRRLRHVLRSRWCYIIPRNGGRYVVGSTVEPAGFDRSLNAYRVKRLQEAAARLLPDFADAKIAEAWTGLRPGTSDNLPLLGETSLAGYYTACGHYRDGILLTPVTAEVMTALLLDGREDAEIARFTPRRFE